MFRLVFQSIQYHSINFLFCISQKFGKGEGLFHVDSSNLRNAWGEGNPVIKKIMGFFLFSNKMLLDTFTEMALFCFLVFTVVYGCMKKLWRCDFTHHLSQNVRHHTI